MSHTRPDGIGSAQWTHWHAALVEESAASRNVGSPDGHGRDHALLSIANSLLAALCALTDHLAPREPTPADLPPIPPDQLAQYRMLAPGELEDPAGWMPIRDGMYVQSAGGYRYEFRITRPGDPS